ncbi:MAG: LemA family protein [Tepidisphaerales bacterium]
MVVWIVLAVLLGGGLLLLLWVVATYNRLVALREAVRAGWAQIDVLLKRRYDLIPNLVETVKGYAAHERQTLEAVIAARAAAVAARTPEQAMAAEASLRGPLSRLLAVAEAYPDLKANQNFLQLQQELADTENRIANERGGYNTTVQMYNTAVMSFPVNVIAGIGGFTPAAFFEVQDPVVREAPAVRF